MKKIILALLLFGVILSVLSVFADGARRVGTGIEWEAHNIRVVVTNGKDDKFISLKGLYSKKLFKTKGWKVGKGDVEKKGFPFLHEGSLIKTVIDNNDNGIDACPEIVSMGVSTIKKEILIARSRAMALLYKTMKTAYLKNDVEKKSLRKGTHEKCVAAKDIIFHYHREIEEDSFLKEDQDDKPGTPRWELWLIKDSNEWRNQLQVSNRIVDAKAAKLYFCSQGEDASDVEEVVYHLNFGIPLSDL
ncbi:MAG: hypothetical protein GY754_44230, partial [bacterium]|nr:hypothetical protein [bacterium]